MQRLVNGIRSILFNAAFFLFTPVFCTLFVLPLCLAKSDRPVRIGVRYYCKLSLWLARVLMGIRREFRFPERLPRDGAIILAAAHQSNMDPMLTYMLREDVTALAKKELFLIPMIGPLLKKMGVIRIDRQAGNAHRGMEDVAQQVKDKGLVMIVYPQATRVPIGHYRKLKSGAFFLQEHSDLDVYPVATNTGLFWTKGFWHRSGTAVFEVGEPIRPGLDKAAFMDRLEQHIVRESDALVREAGYGALLPSSEPESTGNS